MAKPATFMGAFHVCPQVTGLVPHVGGPVIGSAATVIISRPCAAVIGDKAVCVGPPDSVAMASGTVLACNKPMARMGDMSGHGGSIVVGNPTIIVAD